MCDIERERSYPTPFSDSYLLPLLLVSLMKQRHTPKTKRQFRDEYDFIIVGAGSAGSVVASRLSEIPCVSVLLLEAGGDPPCLTEVPSLAPMLRVEDLDWGFKTVSQKRSAKALNNRVVGCPRGKFVGGSSTHNDNMYNRANPKDYDGWRNSGCEGWSFRELLQYFMKLENNTNPEAANVYYGRSGPIKISRPKYQGEIKEPLFQALASLRYEKIDVNGPKQTGSCDTQTSLRKGQRCSAAKAYLVPKENNTNLDILTNAYVTKVLVQNEVATGVLIEWEGETYQIRARKEVIVSGGAVSSPRLLLLSGIGPKDHLEEIGIPLVADLPVGKNLIDQPACILSFVLGNDIKPFPEKLKDDKNLLQYINHRSGPVASTSAAAVSAFVHSKYSNRKLDHPDLMYFFLEMTPEALRGLGFTDKAWNAYYGPYRNRSLIACASQVQRPKSSGTIRLSSDDPHDPPLVDPNYFEDKFDLDVMVEGLKLCHKIMDCKPLKDIGARPFRTTMPGCIKDGDDDAYFRCLAQHITTSSYHLVGSCKMGAADDCTAVLDPRLRVRGIRNLRVIDASIMPNQITGLPNIPTIMIGEKGADMIKEDMLRSCCSKKNCRCELQK